MALGFFGDRLDPVAVLQDEFQLLGQIIDILIFEFPAQAVKRLQVFLDIANEDRHAIRHGLKQSDGQAFGFGRLDEQVSVFKQRFQIGSGFLAGKDDILIALGQLLDSGHVFTGIGAGAGDDQFLAGAAQPVIGGDQSMDAFMLNQPRSRENIVVFFQAILLEDTGGNFLVIGPDSVGDISGLAVKAVLAVFLQSARHGNGLMRKAASGALSQSKHQLGESAPFLMLAVDAVESGHYLGARLENSGNEREQGRAHAVIMNDIVILEKRVRRGGKSMGNGIQMLAVDRRQIDDLDTLILVFIEIRAFVLSCFCAFAIPV